MQEMHPHVTLAGLRAVPGHPRPALWMPYGPNKVLDASVAAPAKPADDAAVSDSVADNFVGGQNFAVSGIGDVIEEVVAGTGWDAGNTVELYLELDEPAQEESKSCVDAGEKSCFFPKQLLAADCDSPLLRVSYRESTGKPLQEATSVAWPSAPTMF